MLLTNTINAKNSLESILTSNACLCAIELCDRSADFVQFADWQPAHRPEKHLCDRSMCDSGHAAPGSIRPSNRSGYVVSPRSLRTMLGSVTVS